MRCCATAGAERHRKTRSHSSGMPDISSIANCKKKKKKKKEKMDLSRPPVNVSDPKVFVLLDASRPLFPRGSPSLSLFSLYRDALCSLQVLTCK